MTVWFMGVVEFTIDNMVVWWWFSGGRCKRDCRTAAAFEQWLCRWKGRLQFRSMPLVC